MLKVVSLYTGIGGLDFGFESAGFQTLVAIDNDPAACRAMRLNRDWPILEGDIHDFSSETILNTGGLQPGEADILIGGPPCQPFSKSSYWVNGDAGRLDDPRADTLTAYLRVLRDVKPKVFLLENVHGLVYKSKDEGLQYLIQGVNEINRQADTNYRVNWKVLNAANFGVPQIRERVFLIASRDGKSFIFPSPTHLQTRKIGGPFEAGFEPFRTVWDAIGDLPSNNVPERSLQVGGKWGDLLPSIPEGQNYLWHTNRGGGESLFGWRTRYWSFLLKLKKDLPSWTIQGNPGSAIGPFHWSNRKLTTHEMCRLQTFPDRLKFNCGRSEAQKMLGNAVPSLLAEVLALEIKRQFLGYSCKLPQPILMPPVRTPPPEEKIFPLASKYLQYIGNHEDHPGEGKGTRTLNRLAQSEKSNQENLVAEI